jgi:hypothetical protein
MTEALAIGMGSAFLAAIGTLIYCLVLKGKNSDLRDRVSGLTFNLAERDRTIAAGAVELDAAKSAELQKSAELARCRKQKGEVYERNATAGVAGGDRAVDDVLGGLYQDPGDQDPSGHHDR